MRKWIAMAIINWLRKPANRQKAKNAWHDLRGQRQGPSAGQSRSPTKPTDSPEQRNP